MMLDFRDKTYLRAEGMIFNVTGYRHPVEHVYASLKYVGEEKWTLGYAAAKDYLARTFPDFVDHYIRVPRQAISDVFEPQTRWAELLAAEPASTHGELHQQALDLARELSDAFDIPLNEFGITDSLLWGDGHSASDIDIVVFGRDKAALIFAGGTSLYARPDFDRPDPLIMTAPYSMLVEDWPTLLGRKMHMGSFRGRLFSLRVVLNDIDIANRSAELPERFYEDTKPSNHRATIEFEIEDASESLCFPALYRNLQGEELVDYSVIYEGVFRPGDRVRCQCSIETVQYQHGSTRRYTIVGDCQLLTSSSR